MPKEAKPRHEKKKGLTDKELIEKYEKGAQPIEEMISVLLSKPNPNAPVKTVKRH
jgi:hypothetical protein